ncbi:hypothetical protein PROFUN_14060, partial [Planoprotostelium fungivorum]
MDFGTEDELEELLNPDNWKNFDDSIPLEEYDISSSDEEDAEHGSFARLSSALDDLEASFVKVQYGRDFFDPAVSQPEPDFASTSTESEPENMIVLEPDEEELDSSIFLPATSPRPVLFRDAFSPSAERNKTSPAGSKNSSFAGSLSNRPPPPKRNIPPSFFTVGDKSIPNRAKEGDANSPILSRSNPTENPVKTAITSPTIARAAPKESIATAPSPKIAPQTAMTDKPVDRPTAAPQTTISPTTTIPSGASPQLKAIPSGAPSQPTPLHSGASSQPKTLPSGAFTQPTTAHGAAPARPLAPPSGATSHNVSTAASSRSPAMSPKPVPARAPPVPVKASGPQSPPPQVTPPIPSTSIPKNAPPERPTVASPPVLRATPTVPSAQPVAGLSSVASPPAVRNSPTAAPSAPTASPSPTTDSPRANRPGPKPGSVMSKIAMHEKAVETVKQNTLRTNRAPNSPGTLRSPTLRARHETTGTEDGATAPSRDGRVDFPSSPVRKEVMDQPIREEQRQIVEVPAPVIPAAEVTMVTEREMLSREEPAPQNVHEAKTPHREAPSEVPTYRGESSYVPPTVLSTTPSTFGSSTATITPTSSTVAPPAREDENERGKPREERDEEKRDSPWVAVRSENPKSPELPRSEPPKRAVPSRPMGPPRNRPPAAPSTTSPSTTSQVDSNVDVNLNAVTSTKPRLNNPTRAAGQAGRKLPTRRKAPATQIKTRTQTVSRRIVIKPNLEMMANQAFAAPSP